MRFNRLSPAAYPLFGLLVLLAILTNDGLVLTTINNALTAAIGIVRYIVWLPLLLAPVLQQKQHLAVAALLAATTGLLTLSGSDGGFVGNIVVQLATTLGGATGGALFLLVAVIAAIVTLGLSLPVLRKRRSGEAPPATREYAPPASPVPVRQPEPAGAVIRSQAALPAPVVFPAEPEPEPEPDDFASVDGWVLPALPAQPPVRAMVANNQPHQQARILAETLNAFGVPGKVDSWESGPTITRFHFAPGVPANGKRIRVSKITGLRDDIALAMSASPVRILAPVPGTSLVGIEVPNQTRQMVPLSAILNSPAWAKASGKGLPVALGQKTDGQPVVIRLDKAPHLLIAGATGSGKSVCLNALLVSLLTQHTPDTLRLALTDPKQVELSQYDNLPHLLTPVVTDLDTVPDALNQIVLEMERRYRRLSENGVRNIDDFNAKRKEEPMPYIVVLLDEFGDLMVTGYRDEVEQHIARLASKARAAGIHLVLATQRPSVDIVTGLIKANFPARIAFAVTSQIDSRVILDQPGAETLLGQGDMLWMAPDKPYLERLQGAFVSDEDIDRMTAMWQAQSPLQPPSTLCIDITPRPAAEAQAADEDKAYKEKAIALAAEEGRISTTLLQRRLRIGYSRAARIVDALEADGLLAQEGRYRVLVEADSLQLRSE